MPDNPNKPVLLNFRCPPVLLESFDRTCAAASKTRTEVLIDLMQRYTASASAAIKETKIEIPSNFNFDGFSRPIRLGAGSGVLDRTNIREKRSKPDFIRWLFERRKLESNRC